MDTRSIALFTFLAKASDQKQMSPRRPRNANEGGIGMGHGELIDRSFPFRLLQIVLRPSLTTRTWQIIETTCILSLGYQAPCCFQLGCPLVPSSVQGFWLGLSSPTRLPCYGNCPCPSFSGRLSPVATTIARVYLRDRSLCYTHSCFQESPSSMAILRTSSIPRGHAAPLGGLPC